MKLDSLYNTKTYKTLLESDQTSLEPTRYPTIKERRKVSSYPALSLDDELERIDSLAQENCQAAYNELRDLFDRDVLTGLKGRHNYNSLMSEGSNPMKDVDINDHLYIVADVDNASFLNNKSGLGTQGVNSVISYIGQLFKKIFSGSDRVDSYRKGGDSFAVTIYVGDLEAEKIQSVFADVIKRCSMMSNMLASQGFHREEWPPERHVQPTISFAISDSDTSASGLLHHIKSGDKGRKPLKYMVVVDRDLRNKLSLSADDINRLKVSGDSVVSVDPDEAVYESKAPVDEVRDKPGVVMLECSYMDIPEQRKKHLQLYNEAKNRYIKEPQGAVVIDEKRGVYSPLKEAYQYSR